MKTGVVVFQWCFHDPEGTRKAMKNRERRRSKPPVLFSVRKVFSMVQPGFRPAGTR